MTRALRKPMPAGLSLGEFAAVLTAIGVLLGAILAWSTAQVNANAKSNEGRVADMQKAIDAARDDADERLKELRDEMARQREDFVRQMGDLRTTLTEQAQIVHRQQGVIEDYVRHVGKLERIMAAAHLEIPIFETSSLRSRGNVA